MLSKTLEEAINNQIKNELYSAYLYLSMSAYLEASNMPGSARWMRLQRVMAGATHSLAAPFAMLRGCFA